MLVASGELLLSKGGYVMILEGLKLVTNQIPAIPCLNY